MELVTLAPLAPDPAVVERLAEIFSSDPDFLLASQGVSMFSASDAAAYVAREHAAGGRVHLLVDGLRIVGVATTLAPHPGEPYPWIGLLLVDSQLRGHHFGKRASGLLEVMFMGQYPSLRLAVLHTTPRAREFWVSLGYVAVDERSTAEGRPATVFEIALPPLPK